MSDGAVDAGRLIVKIGEHGYVRDRGDWIDISEDGMNGRTFVSLEKEIWLKEQLDGLATFNPDWDLLKATQESLRESWKRIKELEAGQFVPGKLKCAKCDFVVIKQSLNMAVGTVTANNEPDNCLNGCGPMWRVTWQQEAEESLDLLEAAFEEISDLKDG